MTSRRTPYRAALVFLTVALAVVNRWEFMLMLAPPRAPGASGYPVNPLAMF